MCALQGLLPGQESPTIYFATQPRDLQLQARSPLDLPLHLISPDLVVLERSLYSILRSSPLCCSLLLQWWRDPESHPTFPCKNGRCDPNKFTVGDVFFAEVFVAYTVCSNGASLFELQHGQAFVCELDIGAYYDLAQRLQDSRRRS